MTRIWKFNLYSIVVVIVRIVINRRGYLMPLLYNICSANDGLYQCLVVATTVTATNITVNYINTP